MTGRLPCLLAFNCIACANAIVKHEFAAATIESLYFIVLSDILPVPLLLAKHH